MVGYTSHYSPSEIRTSKIGRRRTSLGCGTAYQLLPRSPTSEIHGLSWKLLLHAPPGVRRSSATSPRVWRGCHQGGSLAIGIARVTVTPLITGGQDTHTPSHPLFAPADCGIASHRPLDVPPSRPLTAPAGCCIASPCSALSSSRCAALSLVQNIN
jgi:hypothetical protein